MIHAAPSIHFESTCTGSRNPGDEAISRVLPVGQNGCSCASNSSRSAPCSHQTTLPDSNTPSASLEMCPSKPGETSRTANGLRKGGTASEQYSSALRSATRVVMFRTISRTSLFATRQLYTVATSLRCYSDGGHCFAAITRRNNPHVASRNRGCSWRPYSISNEVGGLILYTRPDL